MPDSKEVEKKRYETRALSNLESNILDSKNKDDEFLRPPLNFYRTKLSDFEGNVNGLKMKAISPLTDFSYDFHDLEFVKVE